MTEGEFISVSANNHHQCLYASRNKLNYILINDKKLELVKTITLEYEIACVDLCPSKDEKSSHLCAVGLWTDISARLLKLPSLEQCYTESLGGDVIPRSIIIEYLEQIPYLFASLGDGSVISYIISSNADETYELRERRKVVLGTQPTILRKFKSNKNY